MNLATIWAWLGTAWPWFVAFSAWLLAAGWVWQLGQWIWNLPRLRDLSRLDLKTSSFQEVLGAGPQLTVIVPACNEEASIEATLRSLLASTGIVLQVVAVDDRSTDSTGPIMERFKDALAVENSRKGIKQNRDHSLQVIHIKDLDTMWLGKPHALARAAKMAVAEWILFTDGDVLFAPDALSRALQYATAERADHLVVMPDWTTRSIGEVAMHGAMHALSTWTVKLWRVADPKARDFLGVGAFNLIRRNTYESLGGFEALRMEVLEDLRLGWLVKRAGYRQRVVLGRGFVSVRWAHGAWGVVRNLEKNMFALYRFNTLAALSAGFGLALQIVWPLVAIAAGGSARLAGIVTYAAIAGMYFNNRRVTRVAPGYVLLFPVAAAVFLFAHLRSMALALGRGGVLWRGTLYSLRELRAHAGKFW